MQLTSHKDISYILYFCKHETEYTRSLSDQTIQMVHIGYAYHRAFYEKHGLGLQDVFILKSIYSIAAVALEIPSGYLADVWGRRKCLILGCILFFFWISMLFVHLDIHGFSFR